jgi:hypothetical protein
MKYLDCTLKYIGKTGRTFNIRYKEHIQAIRNNNNSRYSNHILGTNNTHHTYTAYKTYTTYITDNLDVMRLGRKGNHSNTLEKYYICNVTYITKVQ